MSETGFYTGTLRVWRDREHIWIENKINNGVLAIRREDASQLIEALIRSVNDAKYTADEQVHSTE
ncbi:MAG TPA: hypothetical protein VKQ30_03265 [Ktedonobacterales bacterium]|nr:hypothetical protein [Ktedonobacterales bacterium]